MSKKLQLNKGISLITSLFLLLPFMGFSQVQIAHLDCYPQFTTAAEMDAAAALDGTSPFATWRGAYEYAVANNESTVDFASGYYLASALGGAFQWGGSASEFSVGAGSIVTTVNGNGAVLSMEGLGTCTDAFAYITGTGAVIDGLTLVEYCGDDAGAIGVNGVSGWTISNCNFDACDRNGHSAVEISGGASGTITGCNFYNHSFALASAMDINGGNIDIINSTFSCNYRDNNGDSGGAILITGGITTFTGCTFDGNIAGGNAPGGAVSIRNGAADVTFNSTIFTCNEANTLTDQNGGAIHVEGNGVLLDINGCTFSGNIAKLQGGAINCAGAVTTPVVLTIDNTTFDNNNTNTSVSKGGAIYLNNTNATLTGNYLSGNTVATNGFGGGIYVSNNQSGTNATYSFSSNTMEMNTAGSGSDCSGNDVFTQEHISGMNNDLEFLADGHQLSEGGGSLQFTNGDDCELLSNWTVSSQGEAVITNGYLRLDELPYTYATQQETAFDVSQKMYWTINMYTPSTISGTKWPAFALSSDGADLTTSTGYALVMKRNTASSGSRKLQFVYFTAGLDDVYNTSTTTVLADLETLSTSSGSTATKAVYDAGTWTFYTTSAGTSSELDIDSRGFNYCGTSTIVAGQTLTAGSNHVGAYFHTDSGNSANVGDFNNYYFRAGDETTGTGGIGSGVFATCGACLTTTNPTAECADQGSIQGYVFDDTETPDGMSDGNSGLAGVIVTLTGSDGSVVMVTTDATGLYYFGGLSNGVTYTVTFDVSNVTDSNGDPYYPTYQNQPGATNTNDSDADESGNIPPITICVNCSSDLDNTDGTSGSSNYVSVDAGFSANPILPVTFGNIYIKNTDCMNVIEWTTESEVNNDHFEIESSMDGRTFNTIATVKGRGTTSSTSSYIYKDGNTLNSGMIYYRIMQMDYDGKVGYSDVVSVMTHDCDDRQSVIKLYPSVFSDIINYEISAEANMNLSINVYSSLGQLVTSKNIYNSEDTLLYDSWDLSQLLPGVYYVKVSNNDTIVKIVKQ